MKGIIEVMIKAIETHQLRKYYGKHRGIEALDLQVEQGDFFGFIGPNGAGKSTTIRTLLGLIQPSDGEASILGYDIVQDHKHILKKVGYLPAEVFYYSRMRVKDVIRYSARLHHFKDEKRTQALCSRLDLDTNKKVDDLSLGNKKKVGIVCAVQHNPDLIILDEATSGLDPLMQREFMKILEEENQKGTTIFFSSHILSEVQAHCRSAALIKDGNILVSDRIESLEEAGAKKVMVKTEASQTLLAPLEDDIKDMQADGNELQFLYTGDISRLLTVLSVMEARDVRIVEPSLEELFMHYYER